MAATDNEFVYHVLYSISPSIAQRLKPIRKSREDNGIKMEVLFADIRGDSAEILVSMQDQTELVSVDELAVLDGGKCILQLRGVRPFLSDKYDITQHPSCKYLSDYDSRNAFDIEKYLSTGLKPKPDDVFNTYSVDLSGEPKTAK